MVIMNTISISATDLKNSVSEVLNTVYYKKTTAIIERHGKIIAHIIPVKVDEVGSLNSVLSKTFGMVSDFPEVTKKRVFKKRQINL